MAARLIDGKAVAAAVKERVEVDVAAFEEEFGRAPALATVLVGEDPASQVYIGGKRKASGRSGSARSTTSSTPRRAGGAERWSAS